MFNTHTFLHESCDGSLSNEEEGVQAKDVAHLG
ncbi:MAG: hypothetical protein ACJAYN_000655 [Bermanella sp.]|jgi:hypothetical protein